MTIVIVILSVVFIIFLLVPCVIIVILALLGPAIGNVFSNVLMELELTPTPDVRNRYPILTSIAL